MKNIKQFHPFFLATLIATLYIQFTGINHALFFTINAQHALLPVSIWGWINIISSPSSGILPILLLIITACFRRHKIRQVILLIVIYYIVFYCLKISFHMPRPYIQFNPLSFYWLYWFPHDNSITQAYASFPSGHTGNAAIFVFTLSYLFAQNKYWLRTLLLMFLILVMLTRICTGWHFPVDVLAGALIGFVLTRLCL